MKLLQYLFTAIPDVERDAPLPARHEPVLPSHAITSRKLHEQKKKTRKSTSATGRISKMLESFTLQQQQDHPCPCSWVQSDPGHLESIVLLLHQPHQVLKRQLAHAHVQPLPSGLQLFDTLRLGVDARLRQRQSQSRGFQLDWTETRGKFQKESGPTVRGKMTTSPCGPRSMRGSPSASRQVKGGKITSFSPEYCKKARVRTATKE
jgi:hypothetical protein